MTDIPIEEAKLVGASPQDRRRLLQKLHEYLDINARFDWEPLQDLWSGMPEAVFFNLNGHTYNGRAHWTRLWQFYQKNVASSYWTPFDIGGVVSDELAVIWCHRHTRSDWVGAEPPVVLRRYRNEHITRSTMVFRKEDGDWRVVHVHFSEAASTPRPARPDMPIYFASMGDRSLALCGELADGLIVSKLCPPGYTRRAVDIVQQSAAAAGRKAPDVVQYVPCAVRSNRDEALHVAKSAVGEMLTAFWPVGGDWPELRENIVRHSGISKSEMVTALARLRRGEPPSECSTTALSTRSRLPAQPRSVLRRRRATTVRVSTSSS